MGAHRSGSDDLEVVVLSDGRGALPRQVLFSDVPPGELGEAIERDYPPDFPYNCLLVRGRGTTLLVDSGLGAAPHPLGGQGGRLLDELARCRQRPEDVDFVVISHGHPDHIGGLVHKGAPAFERARYVIATAEWSLWTNDDALAQMPEAVAAVAREQLLPLDAMGVLDAIDGEEEISGGVRLIPAPGHTPGHLVVEVEGRLLFAVDALLHPAQVERPETGRGTDADPETAVDTRRSVLSRAADSGLPVGASHIDSVFRVERSGDAFRIAGA